MTLDKQEILEGLDFYRDSPAELRSRISSAARHLVLAPGEWFFREGDSSARFAAVGKGSIRVFRIGSTGREITLYHVRDQQSSLVSILSVLLGRPAIATAQAEVATEVIVLPAAAFREWVSSSHAMRTFIFETVTQALVDVTTMLEDVAFRTMESRLAALLFQHVVTDQVISMRHRGHRRGAGNRARGRQPPVGELRATGCHPPLAGPDRDPGCTPAPKVGLAAN